MRNTDPQQLRKVAAELFVDLARSGDQIAVTGFDGAARESSGTFTSIGTPDTREAVKKQIAAVGDDGDWTDFTAGLSEATRLLASVPKQAGDQNLILFLTDGKCDPDPASALGQTGTTKKEREAACQEKVLGEIVPTLGDARVYAIGLSKAAPKGFLEELGRRTGGSSEVTQRASELPSAFAGVYAQLLGSRLQEGQATKSATFRVYEGAQSLDLIIVGTAGQTSKLFDANGTEIPIHNRQPDTYYFVGHKRYRLFKVANPVPGKWKLSVPDAKRRTFATLQHFDLVLQMVEPPEVAEMGRRTRLHARLATPAGTVPDSEFLDHHHMSAVVEVGRKQHTLPMQRGDGGVFWADYTPQKMGEVKVGLTLEPGPDGVLSRKTPLDMVLQIVPPLQLRVAPLQLGELKQGDEAAGKLDLSGSDLGVDVRLALDVDGEDVEIRPHRIKVPASGDRTFEVTVHVDKNTPPGALSRTLTLTPEKPRGFTDRKITATVSATVTQLSFWGRYGRWFGIGAVALVALVLIGGVTTGSKFPKRSILYYKDVRDPELPRKSSYPLGVKIKKGFYKAATTQLGPTGPMKSGGVVILTASGGGSILAAPVSSSAKVWQVPDLEEDEFASEEDKRAVHLSNGSFRMAPGVHYEIDGAGLVFWFK